MFRYPVLVGDIGGTNARFAIVLDAHSGIREFEPVRLAEHGSIEEIIQDCVLDKTADWPRTMILAAATPLGDAKVFQLTNASFTLDPAQLIERFDLDELVLMNDFAAQALAAIALEESHLVPVGTNKGADFHRNIDAANGPKVVMGPGTGLGVANMVKVRKSWVIVPGEGGHVSLGPQSEREFFIWPHLQKIVGRVSAEQVLSGRGIRNLYQAISGADGLNQASTPDESEITKAALDGSDPVAVECCKLFVSLLGRVAGDLALVTLATGGVYVGGGIAARLLPLFETGDFRAALEDKPPHEAIMKEVPAWVVTHSTAALQGLSSYAQSPDLYTMNLAAKSFGKS